MIPIHFCGGLLQASGKASWTSPIPRCWPRWPTIRGFPASSWFERSGSDQISAAYEQNRQDALAADVFGSPVYVLDGEVFWGQDRIELVADALKSGRAPYRSQA